MQNQPRKQLRVIITGSAGMIGTNLAAKYLGMGHEVIGVDNYWRGQKENTFQLERDFGTPFKFVEQDLRHPGALDEILKSTDVVFHLADVVAGIDFVFANEFRIWTDNMRINANVLESSIRAGVKHFIYVGTACSYPKSLTTGLKSYEPLIEDDAFPANPESSYGWSKLMGEYEIGLASKDGLLNSSILRLHNVYGTPCSIDPKRSQVIPALSRKIYLAEERSRVTVWGSGRQRRSFVHASDVVRALVACEVHGGFPEPIQIGAENSTTIGEIAEKLTFISQKDVELFFDNSKPEGDSERYPSLTRAHEVLGWRPRVNLESGLGEVYSWISQQLDRGITLHD